MNPFIIAACLTALGTITAAVVTATTSYRAAKRVQKIDTAIQTPDGVPDLAELVPRLFDETMRQGAEIDKLSDKLEEHLGWHEGLSDAGQHP